MAMLKHKPIIILPLFILLFVKGFRDFPRATLLSGWVTALDVPFPNLCLTVAVGVKEKKLPTCDLVVLTNDSCFSNEIGIVVLVVWLLLGRCLADWIEITTLPPGCIVVVADG